MVSRKSDACLCRVPIAEAAVPAFASSDQLAEWARANGVELLPDHRGRLSVSMADAYRLREEATAKAEVNERAQREHAAQEKAAVVNAQAARQAAFDEGRDRALSGRWSRKSANEAQSAGWEAVRKAEKDLPQRIKDQLGPVRLTHTPLAGSTR